MSASYRIGFLTLLRKEVMRFLKVSIQTVLAPVVTALLYLLVFGYVLEEAIEVYPGVGYGAFLVPGLVLMGLQQNAFANSSSSIIQSKMNGNIVFVLLSPISPVEFYFAFVGAAVLRGVTVGAGVLLVAALLVEVPLFNISVVLLFAVLSSAVLGALGIIAGIWSDKYDHLSAFQNFIIVPLTFLSGVFYSVHSLPPFWQQVSVFNPVFYMIDGFRFGFLGASDVSPWLSLAVTSAAFLMLSIICILLLRSGYKLRH